MSAEIKTGQVWAWQDVDGAKGPHNFRFEIIEAGTDVTYQYRDAAGFDPETVYAANAEVIAAKAYRVDREPDATPAPLDPSKVKAGDTVTLEKDGALVRDVVIEAKSRGVGQFVFYTAENPDPLIPGTYYLVNHGAWTLTDHQPAPEPEPELPTAPGSLIKSEAGDLVFLTKAMWLDQDHDERNPSDWAAPWTQMVVIDPAAVDVDTLAERAYAALEPGAGLTEIYPVVETIMTHLGIEVSR